MREVGLGGEVWVVGPGGDVVGCSWCALVVQRGYVRGSDSKIYGPCSLGHSAISSVASSVFRWGWGLWGSGKWGGWRGWGLSVFVNTGSGVHRRPLGSVVLIAPCP